MAAVKPRTGSVNNKCATCGKTVYAMEMIAVEDKVFHKAGCLKCTHCSKTLSPGNYASMGGVYYCKPHFKQLFALKGNYDEGFGGEKHAKKWAPQVVGKFGGVEKVVADGKRASVDVSGSSPRATSEPQVAQQEHEPAQQELKHDESASEEHHEEPAEEHHEEPAEENEEKHEEHHEEHHEAPAEEHQEEPAEEEKEPQGDE